MRKVAGKQIKKAYTRSTTENSKHVTVTVNTP